MAPRKKTIAEPTDRVTRSSARVIRGGTRYAKLDPVVKKLKNRRNRPMTAEHSPLPSGSYAAMSGSNAGASYSDRFPYAARYSHNIYADDHGHLNNVDHLRKKEKGATTSATLTEAQVSPDGEKPKDMQPTAPAVPIDLDLHVSHEKPPKGTTTVAFVCKDGVMVASDHPDHSTEEELFVQNIIDLNSHVLVSVSGDLDTGTFLKNMKDKYQEGAGGTKPASVTVVSEWVATYLSCNREKHSSAELLIAGWDDKRPRMYFVDAEGNLVEKFRGVTGCGRPYAKSHLGCDVRELRYDEALKYGRKMIFLPTSLLAYLKRTGERYIYSGRHISGYFLGANGLERVFHNVPVNGDIY